MTLRFLGQFLIEEELIDDQQLAEALELQRENNLNVGQLAIKMGKLTELRAKMIHDEQRRTDARFGDIAIKLGYMTAEDVEEVIAEQKRHNLMLGGALVRNGAITEEVLEDALKRFSEANRQAEQELVAKISRFPYPKVMAECAAVTTRILQRFIFEPAKASSLPHKPTLTSTVQDITDAVFGLFHISQGFSGDQEFVFHILLDRRMASSLAHSFMQNEANDDETLVDAAKEFCNVIVRHLTNGLQSEQVTFSMSPPEDHGRMDELKRGVSLIHIMTNQGEFQCGLAVEP